MQMVNHPGRGSRVGRVSKIKSDEAGANWRLCIDGKPTVLLLSKGDVPRYREPQEYHVFKDDEHFSPVLTAYSVHACLSAVDDILSAIPSPPSP